MFMSDDIVRQLIRQRVSDGRLPRSRLIELGPASGARRECDGCGVAFDAHQRLTVRMAVDDWRTVRLHDECFRLWEVETSGPEEPEV
jgi:hypothetical protein